MIKAITFDLWDTIIHDDSDEPKRAAAGLRSKRDERRHLLWQALNEEEPLDVERVRMAYDVADAAFNKVWREHSITWTIAERLRIILQGLGRTLPEASFAEVVRLHEEMEITVAPDVIPGMASALAKLAEHYPLAIASDAIVSPARCLRQWLDNNELLQYFSAFAFSDEVGRSKPHRRMFEKAADDLGVQLSEMVHIGDREHNDVRGAHAHGLKAVLFTVTRAADREGTSADAICDDPKQLPDIIASLAAAPD